jgi:predicted HicB family RNase H-like nuclease
MGRPRIHDEPRVTTAVRLSPSMRDQLHKAAGDEGVSVNELLVRAMSEYLRKIARPRPSGRRAS